MQTSVFKRLIDTLLDAEQYWALQDALILRPEAGDLIQGTEGLRKIRWGVEGRGKRGGLRMIYYFKNDRGQIYFLYAYPKNNQEDLSAEQKSVLTKLVKNEWK